MSNIAKILSAPQRLEDNLSSRQLFILLDEYLFRAIFPLAKTTNIYKEFIAELVSAAVFHHRKLPEEHFAMLFTSLFDTDAISVRQALKANKDREPFFLFLFNVEYTAKQYENTLVLTLRTKKERIPSEALEALYQYNRMLGTDSHLLSAFKTSAWWTNKAVDFRDQIVEKYLKRSYSKSVNSVQNAPFKAEVQDVWMVCYLIILKAIHMYSSERGVFTTYLNLWLTSPLNNRFSMGLGLVHGSSAVRNLDSTSYSAPIEDAEGTPDAYSVDLSTDADVLAHRLRAISSKHSNVKLALLVSGAIPLGPST